MHLNDETQSLLYLASDELMQTHLSCTPMKDSNNEDFTFVIRTFCYVIDELKEANSMVLKLIIALNKEGLGMTIAMEIANMPNVVPRQLRGIVEHIQKSPVLLQSVARQLDKIALTSEAETAEQAKRAKQFLIMNSPKGITSWTTNRQAKDLHWLRHKEAFVANLSPFTVDDKGGHIAFTVRIGFKHEYIMQCYEVECMMHLFNEGDKLGYFFELYLDQDNFHHQLIYEVMPDQFMENKVFLQQILEQMKQCESEAYDDYLQDLIEKFTASI